MTQTYINNNNRNSTISFESNMTRPSIQLSEHSDSGRTSRNQEPRLIASAVPEQKLSPFARRGSLAAIADRFRTRSSSRSRSQSRSSSQHRKSVDSSESRSSIDSTSSRRSSSSEATGAYADVIKAQEIHMQKLRAKQHILHITHNADGLPLPPYPGTEKHERRRSLVQILGMDKPLLAR